MKLQIACLSLLLASCAAVHGHDHEVEWVDYGDDPMANPDFLAAMGMAGTPGEVHAELAKGTGSYAASGQMWMAPDAPPMPMEATSKVQMLLGGRYLMQEFKTDFMGQPFEGLMIMGYDNISDEYWQVWMDNMSTGYSLAHGDENEDGSIEMSGWMRDVMTPEGRPTRQVTFQKGDGSFTFEMYDSTPDGDEFKVMELTYKKR